MKPLEEMLLDDNSTNLSEYLCQYLVLLEFYSKHNINDPKMEEEFKQLKKHCEGRVAKLHEYCWK
jgi:hypothetical protein